MSCHIRGVGLGRDKYKNRVENKVVDALSRKQEGLGHLEDLAQGQLMSISTCTPTWIRETVEVIPMTYMFRRF